MITIHPEVYRYEPGLHPFVDYVYEDKSFYPQASANGYIDKDDDFLIGDSNGFLMKLDFVFVNTHFFQNIGNYYVKHGVYTHHKPGTIGYREFWKLETHRRRNGMTAPCKLYRKDIPAFHSCVTAEEQIKYLHPLRITGEHYSYLNYGRILRTPNPEEKEELLKAGKIKQKFVQGFPRFWDGDYWNFKTDEFIVLNGFHLCKGKARRKGYSFKRGHQGANTINLNPEITIVLVAFDTKYLTDPGATTDMLKTNLDWFEDKTFWRRGYLSESLTDIELGYKLSKTGNKKYGFRSKALSLSCKDNPNVAVGKGAIEIDFEESGINPVLQAALNVTLSATEVGAESVGTIRVYGTGGTKNANWADFSNAFYGPYANKMMPFENVWDKGARHSVCGFFHANMWNYEPHLDSFGNSHVTRACELNVADKAAQKLVLAADDYAIYCGQRADSPSEAFNKESDNIFSSVALNDHVKFVRSNQDKVRFREGQFTISADKFKEESNVLFKTNDQLSSEGNRIHPYIMNQPFTKQDDVFGAWRIFYEPVYVNGAIPDDLYYIVADPVGKDKSIKEVTTKNSLNAIYVMSYPNSLGIPGDTIQAIYTGRRDDSMEAGSKEILHASYYYNAKALPETDRGTVVADFKRWHVTNRLLKNPTVVTSAKVLESKVNEYGISIGTGEAAVNAIIALKNFLYEIVNFNEDDSPVYRLHYIQDLPTLLELQQFSISGNFDRISALRLAPLQRLAYITKGRQANAGNSTGTFLSSLGFHKKYN